MIILIIQLQYFWNLINNVNLHFNFYKFHLWRIKSQSFNNKLFSKMLFKIIVTKIILQTVKQFISVFSIFYFSLLQITIDSWKSTLSIEWRHFSVIVIIPGLYTDNSIPET